MNEKLFEKMISYNKTERKTLSEKALKLTEESGELAAEILKLMGRKGTHGKTLPKVKFDALLELADIQLMVASICDELGYTHEDLCNAIINKLVKYERVSEKQKKWEEASIKFWEDQR